MKNTMIENNLLDSLFNGIAKIVEYIVMISVGAMGLILIVNVFCRYVLSMPITGTEEVALLLLVWVTFLGACLAMRRRDMVAVTFLIDKFSPKALKVTEVFIQLCILIFSIKLLYFGFDWLLSANVVGSKSSALRIPLVIPYTIFPMSMLIMVVFTLDNIRHIFRKSVKTELSR